MENFLIKNTDWSQPNWLKFLDRASKSLPFNPCLFNPPASDRSTLLSHCSHGARQLSRVEGVDKAGGAGEGLVFVRPSFHNLNSLFLVSIYDFIRRRPILDTIRGHVTTNQSVFVYAIL